jgi:serine/threonine protein kinase
VVRSENSGVGTIINGRYELVQELGRGGMGTVYKAKHLVVNRFFALKLLPADLSQQEQFLLRLDREAKTAGQLNHPNLVSVYDSGISENGEAFIVMDFVVGNTLTVRLAGQHRLPMQQALTFFKELCDALARAHNLGIVHRDLKPSNIMVTCDANGAEHPKIVDFGIARAPVHAQEATLTRAGDILGSPQYMSPEQCRGERTDARSDIYSLGCVMYECLSGRPPLLGQSSLATMILHREQKPAPFDSSLKIPAELETIVLRALEKDADDRFQNAHHLKRALENLPTIRSGRTAEASTAKPEPSANLNRLRLIVVLAVSCLISLGCYRFYRASSPTMVPKPESASQTTDTTSSSSSKSNSANSSSANLSSNSPPGDSVSEKEPSLEETPATPEQQALIDKASKLVDKYRQDKTKAPQQAEKEAGEGLGCIAAVLNTSPNVVGALEVKEKFDFEMNNIPQGIADCKRLIKLRPSDPWYHYDYSYFLQQAHRVSDAITEISKGLEILPNQPDMLNRRAYYYHDRQDFDAAIKDLDKIKSLKMVNSMQLLADSYRHSGNPKAAKIIATQFLDKAGKEQDKEMVAWTHVLRAESEADLAENDLKEYDNAINDYKKSMELSKAMSYHKDDIVKLESEKRDAMAKKKR